MEDLVTDQPFPEWVNASLGLAPFVVVRRAENKNGSVPVGIRGNERGQRFAAWLPFEKAVEVITPYTLATQANWKKVYTGNPPPSIRSLQLVTPLMQRTEYPWGPTGSAGFELTTGMPTLKEDSDLDLIVDLPEMISIEAARLLMISLEKISLVRLDVQMNTSIGGVALKEYITSEEVLIKTCTGPLLQPIYSLWS